MLLFIHEQVQEQLPFHNCLILADSKLLLNSKFLEREDIVVGREGQRQKSRLLQIKSGLFSSQCSLQTNSDGKHKHIPGIKNLRVQSVVVFVWKKTYYECSFKKDEDLRGSWVRVWRLMTLTSWGKVNTDKRDSEGVESGDFVDVNVGADAVHVDTGNVYSGS